MSIRRQILCSLGLMFFLGVVMSAATWTITSAQRDDALILNLAARQRMLAQKIAKQVLVFAHLGKADAKAAGLAEEARKGLAEFETAHGLLSRGGDYHDPVQGRTVRLPAPSRQVAALLDETARQARSFTAEAEAILASGSGASAGTLAAASEAVVAAQNQAVRQLQTEDEGALATLMAIQVSGMALSAVVLALVLVLLGRSLGQPLARLRDYAHAVAGGDLKARAEGGYPPELADLRDAMARMVSSLEANMSEAREKGRMAEDKAAEVERALAAAREQEARTNELLERMNETAGKARLVSEAVLTESGNLLAQAGQVAGGAQHQRDRMMETATAMEEMNATVLEVARSAASAATSADGTKGKAITGAEGVRTAVASIEAVRGRILDLKASMTRLGQQAEGIGNIMNVISDIADQTNLLALNAAIEAARAGDAGRGFAVVADEVRKLAEKTMTATKEVGDAVVSIQTQARENIAAVESAASGIEDSTQAAADSGRFMEEIVGMVEATASQVESIATASEEQSATSEEINRAVEEVSRIAGETAQGMETATAALSALASLAGELDVVIREMSGEAVPAHRVLAPVRTAPITPLASSRTASARPLPAARPAAKALPAPRSAATRAGATAARPAATAKTVTSIGKAASGAAAPLLQWDSSLAVGLKEIDGQHQILVRMICDLHEAMRAGKGKDQVESILDKLGNYAVEHFGYEEKLMEQFKYPGYLNHRKEHKDFVDKVIAFVNDFHNNKTALTTEVMNFLKNWLVGHIKGTDKKYAPFFIERGVQ